MEKNDGSKMIKAEPQQQVSSMITVDVDSQALHCPKCLGPLVPPVFQCAAGHVVCPPCHGDLPDKGKCESCFVKTGYGYSRCFAPTNAVDALCVSYERDDDGKVEQDQLWGGPGGKRSQAWTYTECFLKKVVCLERDEHLTCVKGLLGNHAQWFVVKSLTFVSNRRTYGPYGEDHGVPFELPAPAGGRIVGFHGRSGGLLDAIGTYVRMDWSHNKTLLHEWMHASIHLPDDSL
ncbi:hypothetical protein BRADI_2g01730v3 [Brachypodium distachyon]|uniref:Jacalin-type lectin domain-containing protein n=1 Tax=Brachypodium distachyon TaxID=15368 RepID=I1HBJ5_BRADI|nr:hypothetical protein BRADI_2g01730v3 [Brachypodium distachyon]